MHNGQRLPPRAGSEYDDLRVYGADRYAPTDLRAFAARLDLITASEYEDALRACAIMDDLRACIAMMDMDDLHACIAMMDLFISRVTVAWKPHDACTLKAEMRAITFAPDLKADMRRATFELRASRLPATPAPPPATPTATAQDKDDMQQFLEEQELWLTKTHIRFGAASRIQDDEDLRARAVHFLKAQERLCAQDKDKDNAQYLEQENDGLRIQAETKREMEMDTVAAAESEMGVLCEREMDVAAAEPETGVREMDTTASVKIFAVALQDLYNSKSTAADAPTGKHSQRAGVARVHGRPAPARLRRQERQPHRLLPRQGQGWPPRTHPDCGRGLHLEYCSRRPSALLFYMQGRLKG